MKNISYDHQQSFKYIPNNKRTSGELMAHNCNQGFVGSMS